MRPMIPCALASLLLCSGCSLLPRDHVLPDPERPHRLAKPATVTVWVRRADGSLVQETVTATTDWWIASPESLR